VTGAASGIGAGMAEVFAAAGMKVVLSDVATDAQPVPVLNQTVTPDPGQIDKDTQPFANSWRFGGAQVRSPLPTPSQRAEQHRIRRKRICRVTSKIPSYSLSRRAAVYFRIEVFADNWFVSVLCTFRRPPARRTGRP
jgi:hypothetical protein